MKLFTNREVKNCFDHFEVREASIVLDKIHLTYFEEKIR